jgi:D-3-phosphoglycerate dehydrogenase
MAKALFSAPFAFMPEIQAAYQTVIPTEFREIWDRAEVIPDADLTAWIVNPGQRFIIDDGILDQYLSLSVIVTPSTGSNHIDRPAAAARNIAVYSLLDDREGLNQITASAEFSFLLLLNTLRRLDFAVQEVNAGRWRHREDDLRGHELHGKSVGIIGLGRIGGRLARYSTAFEAKVFYYDPYVDSDLYPKMAIEDIFAICDVVCISCSLTSETTGMINARLLNRLKPRACLVNTSRGEVLNESDLIALLRERDDISVGLDVLTGEVTDTHLQSPLVELHRQGRITITPHIAGATLESQSKAAMVALNLLQHHLNQL